MDSYALIKAARAQERLDIVEWIEAEIAKAQSAREAELAVPLETPVGPMIPGRYYNVQIAATLSRKGKRLRNVTPSRVGWGVRLVYPTRTTAMHVFEGDLKRVVSIEEVGAAPASPDVLASTE